MLNFATSVKAGGIFGNKIANYSAYLYLIAENYLQNVINSVIIIRGDRMPKEYWFACPVCGNPKMLKCRNDTRLINFPGYCKRCKNESIITIEPKSQIVKS